jgi:hypothetical protein
LSPETCRLGAAFFSSPTTRGSKICLHGTRPEWRRIGGDHRRKSTAKRVLVEIPLLGECDDWGEKVVALHVLTHESMHLAGVLGEIDAECLAIQVGAFVVHRLGASSAFARSIAREYWRYYYKSQDRRYVSPDCRSGGKLDVFGSSWPTPARYPPNIAGTIERFVAVAHAPA